LYPSECLRRRAGTKAAELFGKRVRTARKAGLTLEEAAKKAQIHFNHLAQIERGTRRPSFEVIFVLARVLNTPAMSFFVFEREENDAKALRKKIDGLLRDLPVEQLGQTYRFLKFVVGR
jgi:transcriptional regulator with XRE-family HTH domain